MAQQHRVCAQCGADQYRKKVWETRGRKVLCFDCGQRYTFDRDGLVIVQQRYRESA